MTLSFASHPSGVVLVGEPAFRRCLKLKRVGLNAVSRRYKAVVRNLSRFDRQQ